jgi:hypothetical protein
MGKVKINWSTTTIEHFKIEVDESELPENWRELFDTPRAGQGSVAAFLSDYEYEHDQSTSYDGDVLSREAEYQLLDEADFGVLQQALNTAHTATYVPSNRATDLFTVLCSCGESSFGASPRDSAEALHARHAADPSGGHLRDREATERLLARINHPARKATS